MTLDCQVLKFHLVSQEDPHRTVQTFINLIQRHEQAFYTFVHNVHSKGEGLFDSLMRWIERFLTVIREGLGDPINLECLLPHTGQEREDILREVDAVALYHYKLKVLYEDKIRRRFGRLQDQTNADAEDEATQHLVQGVTDEINFGELVKSDALDFAAEESDESENESSGETDSSYSDEEDGEDDTSEEAVVQPKPLLRSRTVEESRVLPVGLTESKSPTNGEAPRPASFSLKLSRSLTSLRQRARRNQDVPPVPPLPDGVSSGTPRVAANDPLPSKPPSRPFADQKLPPPLPPRNFEQTSTSKGKGKKTQALKPPELQHIPKLLPIFTELVSQLL
jgi:Domain of unknown function in PX-proteins (DUF3818)